MCCNSFHIKPVNVSASRHVFCQCGFCEDCRKAERAQWCFRLKAELLGRQKQGWLTGFFTLTYADANVPLWLLDEPVKRDDGYIEAKDPWEDDHYSCFPCFSRTHIRNFILSIRKKLHRDYGITGISYMICSEYGTDPDRTQRPHYHGIISWPPKLDAKKMHEIICQFWSQYGFIFPRTYLGGVDKHGYKHKPFQVDSVVAACAYCAKYVCKDLGFYGEALSLGIDVKDKKFRKEYASFHIQNRGLGQQFLVDLSESERADLLLNGYAFVGDDVLKSVPIYFRNKLIFDTHYVYDISTRARLVRRSANAFFDKYKYQLYEKKKQVYKALFDNLKQSEYIVNRSMDFVDTVVPVDIIETHMVPFKDIIEKSVRTALSRDSSDLAEYFLSYYKVPDKFRLRDPVLSWYNHYIDFPLTDKIPATFRLEVTDDEITCLLLTYKYMFNPRAPDADLVEFVSKFHKHTEY